MNTRKPLSEARVALVHEWTVKYAGSEQVVVALREAFPQADLHVLVHDPEAMKGTPLEDVPVKTSFLQSLPRAARRYQSYLPLMPLAVEQFDLRNYDIVISSHHAVTKGVMTRPDQIHVSYVHTPIRYIWDLYLDYLEQSGVARGPKSWIVRPLLHYIRMWDVATANRVDYYLSNSRYVARRIEKLYRRPAQVVYPPVDVDRFRPYEQREDFYVTVSRLAPYKRVALIVEAFTRMGRPLVVIGDGPEMEKVSRIAGPNVRLLGYQPDEVVADYLQRAKAFVFAAEEDFGIVPVEAQAAGCPVIAYGKGGIRETVVPWPEPGTTGIFFEEQTVESLEKGLRIFEENVSDFRSEQCYSNAKSFAHDRFVEEFQEILGRLWDASQGGKDIGAIRGQEVSGKGNYCPSNGRR